MRPRLIFRGHCLSYGRLLELRGSEEVVVAIWQRDFLNTTHIQRIVSERDFNVITGLTKNGFYHNLCWFGSVTGSTDLADYAMPQ